jgi:glycosyltransferase involved in cell wall biosynthesis
MKFSIITPCFNAEKLIEETILSVLNQTLVKNGLAEVEYIIVDGGSTDNTLKIINSFSSKKNITLIVLSEKDEGMFHALSKGLKISTGHVQAYINAGDFYNLNSFSIIQELFSRNPEINWISGDKYIYNMQSAIIKTSSPYKYRNNLIETGVYGRYLPFIQQESIFWRSKLNNYIDHEKLKSLKLSGDYFLWVTFAKYAKLEIIRTHLSGFKIHPGQLSSTTTSLGMNYRNEMQTFTKKMNIKDFFQLLIDFIPWIILRFSSEFFGNAANHYRYSEDEVWLSNNSTIFCWGCDDATNRGEGQLLYKYISENLRNFNLIKIINIKNSSILKHDFKINEVNNFSTSLKLSFIESYISPFIGVIYLWYKYISGKKVCYVNFLPLWNILLFLLLPPGTKLGPITGSLYEGKVNSVQSFLRKYILPILYVVCGKFILNFRKGNFIFSTGLLIDYLCPEVRARSSFDYIFKNITIKLYNKHRDIDLLVYNRNYFNKSNIFFSEVITNLQKNNFKVYYFGDEITTPGKNYKKIINNSEVQEYLNRTKFTLISNENFFSMFALEAIKNNVNLFYNKDHKITNKWLESSKKITKIDYLEVIESIEKIKEEISNFENYNFPYSKQ